MPDAALIFAILGILFLASLIHATVGFGTALVAMPLLTMPIGVPTATPLVASLGAVGVASLLSGNRCNAVACPFS